MLKPLFLATVVLAIRQTSFAAVTGAEVTEYGVFEKVKSVGPRRADGVLQGLVDQLPEVKLKERTTTIVAARGTSFGILVKLTGEPAGEGGNCSIRWIHPKMTNPSSGLVSESEEFPARHSLGKVEPTGYTFEDAWELVPGKWTVQVVFESKVLAEKTFDVVLPR